jgi:hypothetical protein
MRNLSIALSIVFSVLNITTVNAQPTAKEAKALLEEVSEKVKKTPGIELDFTYSFENPRADASMKQKEKGSIVMAGNNYRLNFMSVDRLYNGDKIYTFLHDDKEVQIVDAEDDDESFTPGFILDMYKEGFSYALGNTSTVDGKKVQQVLMKSLKSNETESFEIYIFTASKQIHKMIQKGRNGGITTFVVSNYKELTAPPKLVFNRKEYMAKGYYIIE